MKNFFLLSAIFFVFIVSSYAQSKVDLIQSDEKFTKDGTIEVTNSLGKNLKHETGVLNGIEYSFYYSDASASFAAEPKKDDNNPLTIEYQEKWRLGCKKDAIDDSKFCYMSFKNLFIIIDAKDSYTVKIGTNLYPETQVAIRIDESSAIKGGYKGSFFNDDAKKILDQLKKGKKATTRHQEFPNEFYTDKTFELYGFNEAFQYINWAFSKIK